MPLHDLFSAPRFVVIPRLAHPLLGCWDSPSLFWTLQPSLHLEAAAPLVPGVPWSQYTYCALNWSNQYLWGAWVQRLHARHLGKAATMPDALW